MMAVLAPENTTGDNHADLLNENVGAVIENPLGHLNEEQLLRDVDTFARRMSFTDILPGLRRAALVAQNIMVYDEVARGVRDGGNLPVQLSPVEKTALKNERDALFSQSSGFYMTILTVSLAALLQGHVQSSINGANLFFLKVYGLDSHSEHDEWIQGVTNAAPFWFAAILGCPLVDPVNRRFGRRGAIMIAAILIFASSLGSAFCNNWGQLFACRIFNGIGMGLKAASTPILASESAVSFWRGSAALCWQLWVAFGIMIGFVVNLLVSLAGEETGMRLMLGAPLVPALILMVSIRWCPESPRWHMINGDANDYRKAYHVFLKLRNTEIQAQRDLYLVHKQIELEGYARHVYDAERGAWGAKNQSYMAQIGNYVGRFTQLFSKNHKRLQNAVLAACTVNLAQQLCGINVLAFYSGTLFSNAGSNTRAALEFSFGFGAVNFFFGLPAIRSIDTLGRRTLLLGTLPFMSICLLAAGLCFYIPIEKDAHIGMIAFFLFLFAALYSPGLGPMPFTLASEAFPLSHREAGVAVSVGVNLFVAGLLTVFYPRMNTALTPTGSLGLFAGLNIIAAVMIFLWVPETKQRSLEELDFVFAVPTKKFMRYQVKDFLPWAFKHYVLSRDVSLKDLYEDKIWNVVHEKDNITDDDPRAEKQEPPTLSVDQQNTVLVAGQQEDSESPKDLQETVQPWQTMAESRVDAETASILSSVGTHD